MYTRTYIHIYGTCTCAHIFTYMNIYDQANLTDQLLTLHVVLDDCTTHDRRTRMKIYMYHTYTYIHTLTHIMYMRTCNIIITYIDMYYQVRLTDQLLTLNMMLDDCTTHDGRTQVKTVMISLRYSYTGTRYIYIYTHIYMHIYTYIYTHTHTHTHTHTNTHIHTHTHTHTLSLSLSLSLTHTHRLS